MARSNGRLSLNRVQAAGEHLVGRLWVDASTLVARSTPQAASDLLAEARRLQARVRKLLLQTRHRVEAQRAEILSSLEAPVTRLLETVGQRLRVASREEVGDLRARVVELERRLDAIGKEASGQGPLGAAGS